VPVGPIEPAPKSPSARKKRKKAKRRHGATPTTRQVLTKPKVDSAELNAPDAPERFRQELACLDHQILALEKELLSRR
jgi:hypothetical protein